MTIDETTCNLMKKVTKRLGTAVPSLQVDINPPVSNRSRSIGTLTALRLHQGM